MNWSLPVTPSPEQEADYPALGFVPCPGDEPTATRVAEIVRETATALDDICYLLNSRTGRDQWRGQTAEAFRESVEDDFRPKVEAARDSFTIAATALEDWADYMAESQDQARRLETEAQEAQSALDVLPAAAPVDHSEEEEEEGEEAAEERRTAAADRERTQQQLDSARSQAETLAADYTEYGEQIADRLDSAIDIAPNKPGWLSSIGDSLGYVVDAVEAVAESALDDIGQWIREHAARLASVGDFLWVISTIYTNVSYLLRGVARFVPVPQVRVILQGAATGLSISSWALRLTALASYRAAEWGGADVDYPWERLQGFWEDMPWEDEFIRRPIDTDQFQFQGGDIESAAAETEPAVTSALGDPADTEYIGLNDMPEPTSTAITDVPLYAGFDNAWNAGSAA
jgi:hypothetical protein